MNRRAPAADVARRAAQAASLRQAEQRDARDFLVHGDEDGRHRSACVHALAGREPCSRDYDPLPYWEAAPQTLRDYAGTGVGALYGLPGSEQHAWQLAGWNIVLSTGGTP